MIRSKYEKLCEGMLAEGITFVIYSGCYEVAYLFLGEWYLI